MAYEDVLYDGKLEITRRTCTWIARRAIAHWADRDWLTFDASTDLSSMKQELGALRALIATAFPLQKGFESFDRIKFGTAWKSTVLKGNSTVQSAYDAAWAGLCNP